MRVTIILKNNDYCDGCPLLDFGRICKTLNITPEIVFEDAKILGLGMHSKRPRKCIEKYGG